VRVELNFMKVLKLIEFHTSILLLDIGFSVGFLALVLEKVSVTIIK
jgi:hypothetical protein